MTPSRKAPVPPHRWKEAELERQRLDSIRLFREQRLQEPLEDYLEAFDQYRGTVEDVLELTVDLAEIHKNALEIMLNEERMEVLRYLPAPPISTDDLKTVTEAKSLAPGRLRADPALVKRIMDTIMLVIDRRRFPWIVDNREPSEAERAAAVIASAALLATQRIGTRRRNEVKAVQENKVREAPELGFRQVPTRPIPRLADGPKRGEFCAETMLGGDKADIVVGLWDSRTMPIECKASNSSVNSYKRLIREATGKAASWLRQFGESGIVPCSVLSGVFTLPNLQQAEARGLTLFWSHDLAPLADWIASTR